MGRNLRPVPSRDLIERLLLFWKPSSPFNDVYPSGLAILATTEAGVSLDHRVRMRFNMATSLLGMGAVPQHHKARIYFQMELKTSPFSSSFLRFPFP